MGKRIAAKITGVAGYVPPRVVTNFDLEKIVDTNDEWIRTRTGIRRTALTPIPEWPPRIWEPKQRKNFSPQRACARKKLK